MRAKAWLSTHWQQLLVAVLTVGVFCYWYFLCPHLTVAREQSQLFLWNWEYFVERIILPGGFAQYVAELLVQFFMNPLNGAIIYAALFVLAWWLSPSPNWGKSPLPASPGWGKIVKLVIPLLLFWAANNVYIPLTMTVGVLMVLGVMKYIEALKTKAPIAPTVTIASIPLMYWLAGPAAILLLACCWRWIPLTAVLFAACVLGSTYITPYPLRQIVRGIDYYWEEEHKSSDEEMRYDLLLRLKDWEGIRRHYMEHPSTSLSIQSEARLADYYLGLLHEQQLYRPDTFSEQTLLSESSAFIMDEVYFLMGMVNMSQRATFEAMESIPNHNKSGRAMKRLAETAIITGQYELAKKYLSILEESTFYRHWAQRMRSLAEHPEHMARQPFYHRLQEAYAKTEDAFFY